MKEFEGSRRLTTGRSGTKGEMNRQISLKSEQMLETEPSIRSVGKERRILLFHATILHGDRHFVEGSVDFERRRNNGRPKYRAEIFRGIGELCELEGERKHLVRSE